MSSGAADLPWRGPGPDRPAVPLPPGRLPPWRGGRLRKRWRYVGFWSEELLLCAARVEIGPLGQTFWAILDRERRELHERTRLHVPARRGEVWTEGGTLGGDRDGALTRIEAGGVRAALRCGTGGWVESVCPNGSAFVWTRKRASPIDCEVRIGERRIGAVAVGIEDETAGYHSRHTVWSWSAGAGRARDGRPVAWNLVSGVNDPAQRSERAIWIDDEPLEPGPVSFDGLEGIRFEDGSRLGFTAEAERRRSDNLLLVRSAYRQPLGTFSGALAGGIELAHGLGVMEHHDAIW